MKRTLIALAVGAAFAAPAAYADVTLSGSISAGPAVVKSGDGSTGATNSLNATGATAQQGITRTGINTNYSNITIGSMEDLGGGLKLDFAFQITANFNDSRNAAGTSPVNRNSHIGLVGDSWGGVWVGTNENLYERYFYTVDPLDGAAGVGGNLTILGTPGYGNVFDVGNTTPSVEFYRRTDNTVWYDSPNWGGFTFGAYTTLSANKTVGGALPDPRIWGIGAKYVGPTIPIQVWAAYERHKDFNGAGLIFGAAAPGTATSSKDSGFQLGVGYTIGDIFVFGNFEHLKYESNDLVSAATGADVGDIEYKRNAFSIGLKWNIPTGYVGAQYMQALKGKCGGSAAPGCNADETGAKSIGLGYYHTLSKQTMAFIMGQYINNDDLQFYTTAGGTGVPTNLGANVWAVNVGLRHSF